MTTGLIIGKFMPPHRGHMHLIDHARSRVNHLTVLVCSLAREPIPGVLRYQWMRELYPDVNVQHCTDENPSYPEEHPDFWNLWTRSIRRFCPTGPDIVFTSETYGDPLAECLGARHELVDLARQQVPISATQIRERPLAHWEFIPAPARPYFVRRVCVLGAPSAGKTWLAEALAKHFHTVWVPEYAREYLRAKSGEYRVGDLPLIARGQAASEEALARQADRLLVCDTNLLAMRVWCEQYWGACPEAIRRMAEAQRCDLYLLCDPDRPWMEPERGQALTPRFHERYRRELEKRARPCVALSGSLEERLAAAIRAVQPLLDQVLKPSAPA